MAHCSRRDFLKNGLAAAAVAGTGRIPLGVSQRIASDWATLGTSGVEVTRLAFGTGTEGGRVQRELGQEQFTRLVRHAYERGIRLFDTAEAYEDMHRMLGVALEGIPRESYRLMSKITTHGNADPQKKIDELRTLARTEYFDLMMLHLQHRATWPQDSRRWEDGIVEAQARHAVIARGASVHGLPALRKLAGNPWLEVALVRVNHTGTKMDAESHDTAGPGNVVEVTKHVRRAHDEGLGVIGMKLVGNGTFTTREDRRAAMRYAFRNAGVDCVTVGFKSTAEIDEAIENVTEALASRPA